MKNKLLAIFTSISLVFNSAVPVLALEAPDAPTPPPAPQSPLSEPTPPPAPEGPPPAPTPPGVPAGPTPPPSAPPAPTPPSYTYSGWNSQAPSSSPIPSPSPKSKKSPSPDNNWSGASGNTGSAASPAPSPSDQPAVSGSGGQNSDGGMGTTAVNTGTSTSTAVLTTDANTNLAGVAPAGGGSGAQIVNSGNGTNSQNNGSAVLVSENSTVQNNTATVNNNLSQTAVSGQNSASGNTGGDVSIATGDANVSGTMITAVNTNLAGVVVSEFNITDSHTGDYILDFAANCIYGCLAGGSTVANFGNGTDSQNYGSLVQVVDNTTFQNNEADISNTMSLLADSGNNRADRNTGGNTSIATGDANVSASSLTMANNNLQGNIIYGVVNIYGDLIGDIIFPEEYLASCCGYQTRAVNSGNGSGSQNASDIDQANSNTTVQTNLANVNNNLILDANSGGNQTSRNTDGSNSITTGNTSVDAQVLNIVNTNISGGLWWLVLVNEAGNWIGKIFGADDNANFAATAGTEFKVNEYGEITVINSGNGADSQNAGSITQVNNNTTVQTNTINLNNTINLTANTGNNSASRNTGGVSAITTGDANIIANLVNFVNNNITGGGKMVVTVVNVFGSWLGDFVGPGQKKAEKTNTGQAAMGGAQTASQLHQENTSPLGGSEVGQPQATTVTSPVSAATGSILAAVAVRKGNQANSQPVKIAAYSIIDDGVTEIVPSGRKTIHINLAWLLLILPAGGILLAIRKILLARAAR